MVREFPGLAGTLYIFAEWVMRFSTANLLWFTVNLPIMLILASVYINGFSTGFFGYLIPLAVLIPAVLVPSTLALFAIVREWVVQAEQSSIIKSYFSHIRANYCKSLSSGAVLLLLWLIWLLDFYFFKKQDEFLGLLFLGLGLGLFVFTLNFFSLSVHYQMKNQVLFKNAFFVTIGNPFLSIFILTANLALFYTSTAKVLFLLPLFTVSVSAFLSFLAFYRFSLKTQKKVRTAVELEADKGKAISK